MPMNTGTEKILQQFWGLRELDQVTVDEIEAKCVQYPYFAPLQLLLAQKYKQQQHVTYAGQAAKTSVYFNNWHWLNELLEGRVAVSGRNIAPVQEEVEVQPAADLHEATNEIVVTDVVEISDADVIVDEPIITETKEDAIIAGVETEPGSVEPTVTEDISAVEELLIDEKQSEDFSAITEQPSAELNEDPVELETFTEPVSYTNELKPADTAPLEDEPIETPAPIPATGVVEQYNEEEQDDEPFIDHQKEPTALPGIAEIKHNINLLKNTLADLSTGSAPVIPIEPLYTIDYFASQGIKLKDLGIDPKDQLGQKLKSFTEWLKTMKKLHPEKLETKIDDKAQSSIQNMAEHSNSTQDVLTESIAEVYARQGLKEKAREVYLKLSLLNPGKSAYFAAKISNLNEL